VSEFKVGDRVLVTIPGGITDAPATILENYGNHVKWPYSLVTDSGMETMAWKGELKPLPLPLVEQIQSLADEYEETSALAGPGIRGGVYGIVAERLLRLVEEAS
jgi:hypothetical protein